MLIVRQNSRLCECDFSAQYSQLGADIKTAEFGGNKTLIGLKNDVLIQFMHNQGAECGLKVCVVGKADRKLSVGGVWLRQTPPTKEFYAACGEIMQHMFAVQLV